MVDNPLRQLHALGQSIWLDYIRRHLIASGELRRLLEEDSLGGVTSNPAIFEKALAGSHDYDQEVRALTLKGKKAGEIYETLAVEDVRMAAEVFRTLYDESQGYEGYVSLEVNPHLAHDTQGTIAEARRLWARLERPNVFIKVPATRAGLPAITQLIGEGINVNVTLLFGLPRYREVLEAYLGGLEKRAAAGRPLKQVTSVASFFLSRIDTLVDPILAKAAAQSGPQAQAAAAAQGQVAIACARAAYSIFQEVFDSQRFQTLAARGAQKQRLLWASTSTKNPAYLDVHYVEGLIGPETINTMPLETLNAYRDHGQPALSLTTGLPAARDLLQRLPEWGIDLDRVTQQLEDEGVEKFCTPFDSLMCALKGKREEALIESLDRQNLDLGEYGQFVQERLEALEQDRFIDRLWRKDGSLWTPDPERQKSLPKSLGWLHAPEKMEGCLGSMLAFSQSLREGGIRHVALLGMGGSSLAPLVFQRIFPPGEFGLPLTVLDTTDPGTILDLEKQLPLKETLFIIASKSGTTAEPLAFGDFFYHRLQELKGDRAGENFLVITDPGSPLTRLAHERGFRGCILNFPDIGGRYSALSFFGLMPAALMRLNLTELVDRALRMLHACSSCVPVQENPGLILGAALGELARRGRDKVTFISPEILAPLGMWLEQLLAESTGKEGTGLLPVAGEPLGAPEVYGPDRVFVYFRLPGPGQERLDQGVAALRQAGHPLITIQMTDPLDLGEEFFRWEIATAVAGAVLGINPFDQPNVQESKDNTNRLLTLVGEQGHLPEEPPDLVAGPLGLYSTESAPTLAAALAGFVHRAQPGDYVALLAYLSERPKIEAALEDLRLMFRDHLHLATTLGFGPRYLHSTGQLHKGGPNTGLFLELTCDDLEDPPVFGKPYTFGIFKNAQALGDMEALRRHGRRVLRVHLGTDVLRGLAQLQQALSMALTGD
jgi:transaldolase/glucose-6-phosphate isomerase